MFSEINERLIANQSDQRKKRKYEAQLEDYNQELETINAAISRLTAQFKSEKKDVEKLEHISLTHLIAVLTGKLDEKLTKEQQELAVAQHRLGEAHKTKKEIEEAITRLSNQLLNYQHVEETYQDLLSKKEAMIKSSTSPYAKKLFEWSEQEGEVRAYILEIREAEDAGKKVDFALKEAIHSLESAENWGTWDMLGGGTFSGMMKHNHIDQAESKLHEVQKRMRHFQKELLDVQESVTVEIDISGMLKFADFFFDGFFVDFMVQEKIEDSLSQARNQHNKIREILTNLEQQVEVKETELEKIQNEKRYFVESLS